VRDYIDISIPIHNGMLSWPTDPKVEILSFKDQSSGKASNVSTLSMGTHTGTHIDPPVHFLSGGDTLDDISLNVLIGPAKVVELDVDRKITAADIMVHDLTGVKRILFKTKNSRLYESGEFVKEFVYLSKDGAEYLVEQEVRLVGIDYLSIDEYGNKDAPAHHVLLEGNVTIIESIDLSLATAGEYELVCLPLRVRKGNGGPARAVLFR